MGRRRGFFAELQHQQRVREQQLRREQVAAVQAHNRAVREEARLRREYERELAAAQRLHARSTAESIRAHKALQVATAQMQTADAVQTLDEIDSILSATLDIDDYVDIDSLKQTAQHPPFPRADLETPIPKPKLHQAPAEPQFNAPPPPTGLSKVFGKQKHAQETAAAHAQWVAQHQKWHDHVHRELPLTNAKILEQHAAADAKRARDLERGLDTKPTALSVNASLPKRTRGSMRSRNRLRGVTPMRSLNTSEWYWAIRPTPRHSKSTTSTNLRQS